MLVEIGTAAIAVGAAESAGTAAPITVCSSSPDYTTIQAAIGNAPNRATIQIPPGTYGGFSVPT
ncbi:MAG TPA: hypothetical protein VEF89_08065 [Solirubrobacteraceae bacterium]|nr:hypothetical protein [Solirubrobacteraceae bacterium]